MSLGYEFGIKGIIIIKSRLGDVVTDLSPPGAPEGAFRGLRGIERSVLDR